MEKDKYDLDEYNVCHEEDDEFVFTSGRSGELQSALDEDLDHDSIMHDDTF